FGRANNSTGNYAFTANYQNTASAPQATAFGWSNIATNNSAFVIGEVDTASGAHALAGGNFSKASGFNSVAIGYNVKAAGYGAATFGQNNYANGNGSFVAGVGNYANANQDAVFGNSDTATGANSFISGYNNTATQNASAVLGGNHNLAAGSNSVVLGGVNDTVTAGNAAVYGQYNRAAASYSFAGGFQSYNNSSAGIVVGYNDTIGGFASAAFGQSTKATGNYSFAAGYQSYSTNTGTVALGYQDSATASGAVALGNKNRVTAGNGFAAGYNNQVNGNEASAMGNGNTVTGAQGFAAGSANIVSNTNSFALGLNDTASGYASVALNRGNLASGNHSMALGSYNTAPSYSEVSLGIYGTVYTPNSTTNYNGSDRVFNVGNGSSSTTRSDAFTILKNGNIGVGYNTPTTKLDVNGKTRTTTFQMTNGAANGYILQSDAAGNGTWVAAPSAATDSQNLYLNGTNLSIGGGNTVSLSGLSGWTLTGNTGTTNGTNFLGTTDNQALDIRTNNVIRTRITNNGQIEVLNTGQSVFVGEGAGASDNLNNNRNVFVGYLSGQANTTGYANVAVGHQTLKANTTGLNNTAVGFGAQAAATNGQGNTSLGYWTLANNASGNYNTALGLNAMQNSVSASFNIALGVQALYNITNANNNTAIGNFAMNASTSGSSNVAVGSNAMNGNTTGAANVAVGREALYNNTTNSNNTVLGYQAGYLVNGAGNVMLGYQAGYNETGANKLYIDNSNTGTPLIYGNFSTNSVTINDSLISKYYKMTNGAANGYILQSDAAGNGKWVDATTLGLDTQNLYLNGTNLSIGGQNSVSLSSLSGWALTGNTGTNAATNFMGTSDNADVVFKRNNDEGFRLTTGGAFLASGNTGTGVTPASGAGVRLMWIPAKSSFRAGSVSGAQWDNGNIGSYSAAFGQNNQASGSNSFAAGSNNYAGHNQSVAFGDFDSAFQANTFVSGYSNDARQNAAAVVGGHDNNANGNSSIIAGGSGNSISGASSFTTGTNNTVTGNAAAAFGTGNTAPSFNEVVIGNYATNYTAASSGTIDNTDRVFNVGNGTGSGNRHDAFTILKSGRIGVGTNAPDTTLHVVGSIKMVDGNQGTGKIMVSDANGVGSWTSVATALGNTAWGTGGNTGTVAGTNFIGTTDNIDWVVKTNNTERMRVLANGKIGIGTTAPAYTLDVAGQGNFVGGGGKSAAVIATRNVNPGMAWNMSGNATDEKWWDLLAASSRFLGRAVDDGNNSTTTWLQVNRGTGININSVTFPTGLVGVGTVSPAEKLHVVGSIRMEDGNQGTGKIMVSDVNGTGSWQDASTIINATAWSLTGNTGTTDGVNFIGTTDNVPFTVRTNNQQSGRIDPLLSNTFWGYWAGKSNTTGTQNTATGINALLNNTTGQGNVAMGVAALESNTTTWNLTAVGAFALQANTTGDGNVAVGFEALKNNTVGYDNTALGYDALVANTSGNWNTALGFNTLRSNTTGFINVAIGPGALGSNTSGSRNLAVGMNTMAATTTGANNSAFGVDALGNNTTGNYNEAQGYKALQMVTSGTGNIGIGFQAGVTSTTANANLTGNYNVFIGYSSGPGTSTQLSNAIAIGKNALVSQSNTMVLGGTGVDAVSVGVGTTTPSNLLHLVGTANVIEQIQSSSTTGTWLRMNNTSTGGTIWDFISTGQSNSEGAGNLLIKDNSSVRMMIKSSNGAIGMGTTNPTQAYLVVNGTLNNTLSYGYLNSGGATGTITNGTAGYSIYASGRIAATEFNAYSDVRIKNVIGVSNGENDLNTLAKIQITDYKFIDTISKGNGLNKKVIAQQVEQVYPQAVSHLSDYIPNIYKLTDMQNGRITVANDLKSGDMVKLIFADREEKVAVLSADAEGFTVALKDNGKVFVFGKEVSDFRTVDYEALTTLNVSATQELLKMINQLQQNNAQLQHQNTEIENKMAGMQSDLEMIKTALQLKAAGNK
ncbi:MAG: tail fiber domain-containing protein, partial [Chitinophagales bacterium]